jgi:hypothetical protein
VPDDPKLWLAVSTSLVALAGTGYTAILNYRGQQRLERLKADLLIARDERQAELETQKIMSRFRDPLMHAAYDLQSRIFNILRQQFLPRYLVRGAAREQEYAVENTVFLFAQFLGWTEAIREELQFLDLGAEEDTKKLRALQNMIYHHFQTDDLGPGFRLFAGEQRAIGELMIDRKGGAVCRCIGFATFTSSRKPEIDQWLNPVREDIRKLAVQPGIFDRRLTAIQHAMIDLLEFLDPEYIRFPHTTRSKV